jgi:hypothetical protein
MVAGPFLPLAGSIDRRRCPVVRKRYPIVPLLDGDPRSCIAGNEVGVRAACANAPEPTTWRLIHAAGVLQRVRWPGGKRYTGRIAAPPPAPGGPP